ncbi:TRAP-type C4-dicarboxylate transport system, small permease component [Roseovarius marisflavi]|uniref:TRAP transporter small permease protein n=1 Tax=Roseovarius marisflavi TaxID=1054996 RepID=A0A1M6W036_9RHOB|nr:TRAP transporter small permease subunit [Roseovarius marisflavi]SHK86956.1 TRAP-type C4-dicarboxylate transport system, small permease component [Roseovarius marisflavi]
MSILSEAWAIIPAFASNDSWEINQALRTQGAWVFGSILLLLGSMFVLWLYKRVPLLDKHLERTIMVYSYLLIAAIIFVEVFRRFAMNQQVPWSTTVPPLLFMIMAWYGCAYNVRLRTHLSFAEFRTMMPRLGQMITLALDAVLWFGFCVIVFTATMRVTALSATNFQIVSGTDNVMLWWFLVTIPVAFVLMSARVLENLLEDIARYKSGEPLIKQAIIGEEPA